MKASRSFLILFGGVLVGGALSLSCDTSPQREKVVEVEQEVKSSSTAMSVEKRVTSVVEKSSTDVEGYCQAICTKSKTRGCSIDLSRCAAMCRDMTLEPECRGEMGAALECLAGLSDEHWECGEEGFPEVLPGHCDGQQKAVIVCLSAGLK